MLDNDLITIIVPCYNVEKYISKCLDSLIHQSYKNIEIICIDDCSTDDTYSILQKYNKKSKLIKLFKNDNNKGLSYVRNKGLKLANGSYISFIDSDDFVPENFLSCLYNQIKKEDSDICICDVNYIDNNSNKIISFGIKMDDIISKSFSASACNKLFKKDVFDNIEFPVGKINEDVGIILPLLYKSKVTYTSETVYNYFQRNGSIQNMKFSDSRFDIFDGVKKAISEIDDEEIVDGIIFNQIISLHLFKIALLDNNRYKWLKKYRNKYIELNGYKNNRKFEEFLKTKSKISKIYFELLFKLNKYNLIFLENILISLFLFWKKKQKITCESSVDDLVFLAEKQSLLKEADVKISVVVPNYNYERFLIDRLYSILQQDYPIYELIILDDCSTDDSLNLIYKIEKKIKKYINIKVIENDKNSGSSFKQWNKGFENASGDYVWIAEADDYCDRDFLKKIISKIDSDVVIAYSNTAYIDVDGYRKVKSIFKYMDINKTHHWKKSYVNSGIDEYNDYSYLFNTIPNVSSCIIKNGDYSKEFKYVNNYKQAGDWLFYVMVMMKGKILFIKNTNNYYREHGNNVSTVFKKEKHMKEIEQIQEFFIKEYGLNDEQKRNIENNNNNTKKIWGIM